MKNNPVMDRFKEIRLDTKGLQLNTFSFTVVLSPDGGKMPEATQVSASEIYPPYGDITWEPFETLPETSAIAVGAAEITPVTESPLNLIG